MTRSAWRLSGYTVETLLGAGASSEVWRATVNATGAPVAVKRIPLGEGEQRRAALAEAAMLQSLDHPHLITLHDVRQVDDYLVLVLDLAEGGSLAELLQARGRLTPGEVITALAPVGAALAYAHQHGVVHGDVTPANVLFTDIGLPLLADLGVARLLGDGDFGDAEVVRTTPSYAAPGVAAGGIPTTGSDVFMLGATALHALTGRPPWPGDASNALAAARSGRLPELSELFETAGVPEPVAAVVARALELDAARRATAAEFALELRHAARPVAVELHAGRGPVSDPGRRPDIPPGSVPLRTAPPRAAVPPPGLPPGRAPLTDGVRAPSPFAAQPGRHAVRERRTRRTLLRVAVIAAVVIGVLGFWVWQHKEAPVPAPRAADGLATSASSNVAGPSDPPSQPVTQSPTPAASGTATSAGRRSATPPAGDPVRRRQSPTSPYLSALQRLDALRARAYASRAPDLLARVYASRALRARDMAAMRAAVPPGCGLRGLHTRFEAVRALAVDRTSVVVRTRAVVSPAVLRCGQSGFRALRAPPPVRLTIRLARGDGGLMIAGLTR